MEFAEFISVPQVEQVTLTTPNQSGLEGTLCITSHHLILASRQENQEEFWLQFKNIDLAERKGSNSRHATIYCKDFRIFKLEFPASDLCAKVIQSITKLSNIADVHLQYPFFYNPKFEILEDGWLAFTPESEYAKFRNSQEFRFSTVNQNYRVCKSYPQLVVVPKGVDDDILEKSAAFRQHGRFPVLCYLHKATGAYLVRCSQPLVGTSGRRCKEDEQLLSAYTSPGRNHYVIDTRKHSLAKSSHQKVVDMSRNLPILYGKEFINPCKDGMYYKIHSIQ